MPFLLDMKTVYASLVIGHLFAAVLITAYWDRSTKDMTIVSFLFAKLFQAFTWALLILKGGISDLLTISLSNSALFLGDALEMTAVLRLLDAFDRKVKTLYVILTAFNIAGFHMILLFRNAENSRIAFMSIGTAFLLILPAYRLIREKSSSTIMKTMGYFYLLMVAVFLGRTVASFLPGTPMSFYAPSIFQTLSFIALYLVMISGNTGFVLLLKERTDRELLRLANYDDLTGALNRRTFIARANRHLAESARKSKPVSLLLIDVDNFKSINDTYGHTEGDRVLTELSRRIMEMIRPEDLFSRYGGDEFTMLLAEMDEAKATDIAERIRQAAVGIPIHGGEECFSISLGVLTVIPDQSTKLEAMYSGCDKALYAAKREGRNRVFQSSQFLA